MSVPQTFKGGAKLVVAALALRELRPRNTGQNGSQEFGDRHKVSPRCTRRWLLQRENRHHSQWRRKWRSA